MGLRGTAVRLVFESILARRARVPSADEPAYLRDEKTGLRLANLP
jgi:hypothetical protein